MFCISDHSELYIIYVARGKGQVLDFASSKFVFKR
ncbi:rCG50553 [Rattus norvegicus]|uniref:RCG50553 n=1 Tax=Rattus norvegicus TaxID=10116 RepID=A6KCB5_RAT|nr:rCG50553 [Rattus norvegicus]